MYAYIGNYNDGLGTLGTDEPTFRAIEKKVATKCNNKYTYTQDTVYTHNFMNMHVDSKGGRRYISQIPVYTKMLPRLCFINYDEKQIAHDMFPILNKYMDTKSRNVKDYVVNWRIDKGSQKQDEIIVSLVEEKYDHGIVKYIVRLSFNSNNNVVPDTVMSLLQNIMAA